MVKAKGRPGWGHQGQDRRGRYVTWQRRLRIVQLKSPERDGEEAEERAMERKRQRSEDQQGACRRGRLRSKAGPGAGQVDTQTFQRTEGQSGRRAKATQGRLCVCVFLRIKDESLFSSASVHMPYVRCCWSGKHVALT